MTDDARKKVEHVFGWWEGLIDSYTQITGLWYWYFKRINLNFVFYPIITIFMLVTGKEIFFGDIAPDDAVFKFGASAITVGVSMMVSQVIHEIWPRPADGVDDQNRAPKHVLRKNLAALIAVLIVLCLVVHEIVRAVGGLSALNSIVDPVLDGLLPDHVVSQFYWFEDIYESFVISALVLTGLVFIEKFWNKRPSGSSKTVQYLIALLAVCTISTATITHLWF